jgi:hypothetical protein
MASHAHPDIGRVLELLKSMFDKTLFSEAFVILLFLLTIAFPPNQSELGKVSLPSSQFRRRREGFHLRTIFEPCQQFISPGIMHNAQRCRPKNADPNAMLSTMQSYLI